MGSTNEIVIVERKNRVGRVKEFRMEDHFHAIGRVIEQLHSADLGQNRVRMIIRLEIVSKMFPIFIKLLTILWVTIGG